MKLTGRQRDFLSRFLDLWQQVKQPLHYSTVAERLGISPMTAYDMLRLLEERRLVASEYVVPQGGPGRSTIVFSPTAVAAAVVNQLTGEDWDREEWEAVKERILQALRKAKEIDCQSLLDEILLRIPERKSPMVYATEMITAVLLNLHQLEKEVKASSPMESLRALGWPGELGLNALAGLTLGLTFVEQANRRITSLLVSYSRRYQDHLARLSAENKKRLSDFAQEVMRIIET